MKRRRPRKLWIVLGLLVLFPLLLTIDAFYVEPQRLIARHLNLKIQHWPSSLDGMKIVAVSDLHAGAPYINLNYLDELVARINREHPDVVVLLGDFVIQGVIGGRFITPAAIAGHLSQVHARLGVYAVLGNHDNWYGSPAVTAALTRAGIRVLSNSVARLHFHDGDFWLAGLQDVASAHPDIDSTLSQVSDDSPVIVITHSPDIFPWVPARVSLTLAGHTHGGQVNLPGLGPLIVPSRYGQRYAGGHIRESGRDLYVTTGVGTSIIPVRFRVAPEIVVLTLTPATESTMQIIERRESRHDVGYGTL
ncbi:MAG TPA: metallophosphoesterase [Terriglobales bacterium]|nr:metallophosphoesterase [Terriglobales bacterium]